MGEYIVSEPMVRMSMDYLGPIRESGRGNKYILVVMDNFSKWAEAVPTKAADAYHTANALYEHIFTKFGFPEELHSDRGTHFTAATI